MPVVVVRHRVTDAGDGAVTSPLSQPWPGAARPDRASPHPVPSARSPAPGSPARLAPPRRVGAHARGRARRLGWGDRLRRRCRRLARPAGRALARRPVHVRRVRRARSPIAWPSPAAAASGAPALAQPSRITECRNCPWWPTCEAELSRAQDVSLVVRGEVAVALRAAGIGTVAALAARDPRAGGCRCPACSWPTRLRWPGRGCAACRWCGGCPRSPCCGPMSRSTSTWRASVSPAPTCGGRC